MTPTRRDRLRPFELLGLSAGFALFVGMIVLAVVREPLLAAIFAAVAFIVTLVVLAMLALSTVPDALERSDLDEQDGAGH